MKNGVIIYEKDIIKEICEYLTLQGYFFWRQNNIPVFGKNNGGRMVHRSQSKYTPKGLPDIMLLKKGKLFGLEVKRNTTLDLRPEQKEILNKFFDNGGLYFKVASVEEVKKIINYYDIAEQHKK